MLSLQLISCLLEITITVGTQVDYMSSKKRYDIIIINNLIVAVLVVFIFFLLFIIIISRISLREQMSILVIISVLLIPSAHLVIPTWLHLAMHTLQMLICSQEEDTPVRLSPLLHQLLIRLSLHLSPVPNSWAV